MKHFCALLLLLYTFGTTNAQKNWQTAYLITAEGKMRKPVYLEVGLTTGYLLHYSAQLREVRQTPDGPFILASPEREARINDLGGLIGFGILVNRLQLGLRTTYSSLSELALLRLEGGLSYHF